LKSGVLLWNRRNKRYATTGDPAGRCSSPLFQYPQ
jgi:hypothetical protein